MALNASESSLPNNATRLMSPMTRSLCCTRLLDHHVVRIDFALAEPGRPAELAGSTEANAWNLHITQQQAQLPRPFIIRVEAHQRVELSEPACAGQKISERAQRQRPDHDFELVLTLPRGTAQCGAVTERCSPALAETRAQTFRNREPRALELPNLDGQPEVV